MAKEPVNADWKVDPDADPNHTQMTALQSFEFKSSRPSLAINSGKAVHIHNSEIRKAIDNLNLKVGKAVHDLPFAGIVRKGCDQPDVEIGEGVPKSDKEAKQSAERQEYRRRLLAEQKEAEERRMLARKN